jgi:RNA ligase
MMMMSEMLRARRVARAGIVLWHAGMINSLILAKYRGPPYVSLPSSFPITYTVQWKALETHTTPPYVLTLKSNGCIIFIAPLTPSKLLITSKHSIGPVVGQEQSHAEVSEQWLRKHLESVGKTEADLAQTLSNNNWTAVAEVSLASCIVEHAKPIAH